MKKTQIAPRSLFLLFLCLLLVIGGGIFYYYSSQKTTPPPVGEELSSEELALRDTYYYKTCIDPVEQMGGGVIEKLTALEPEKKTLLENNTLPQGRDFLVKGFEPYTLLLMSMGESKKKDDAFAVLSPLIQASSFTHPLFASVLANTMKEEIMKTHSYIYRFISPETYSREEKAVRLFFESQANLVLLQLDHATALSFAEKEQYKKEYLTKMGFTSTEEMEDLVGKAISSPEFPKRILLPYEATTYEQYLEEFQLPLAKYVLALMKTKGELLTDSLYVRELLWKNSPFRDNDPYYFPRSYRLLEQCTYPVSSPEQYMNVWWAYWVDFMLAELTPMQKDGSWKKAELTKALYMWMTADLLEEHKNTDAYKEKYKAVEQFFGSFAALEEAANGIQYGDPRSDWFEKKTITQ